MKELKEFFPYVKKKGKLYGLGFVGSIFRFLIPLSVPLILKYIFDELLQNEALSRADKMEQLLFIAVGMVAVFLFVRTPAEYMRQYCIHIGTRGQVETTEKVPFFTN